MAENIHFADLVPLARHENVDDEQNEVKRRDASPGKETEGEPEESK